MATANPVESLGRLAAGKVEFIVVGMTAGVLRGAPVTTADVDIVHRRNPENISRLLTVLGELDLDCLGTVGDGQGYEDLLARAPEMELRPGVPVRVIDLPTLIALKEMTARPKDLAALPILRATLAETLKRG